MKTGSGSRQKHWIRPDHDPKPSFYVPIYLTFPTETHPIVSGWFKVWELDEELGQVEVLVLLEVVRIS